jgi:hypothetical protein
MVASSGGGRARRRRARVVILNIAMNRFLDICPHLLTSSFVVPHRLANKPTWYVYALVLPGMIIL